MFKRISSSISNKQPKMSQLLVVFGATGNQGGSVAKFVIKDPELSKIYKVRGVTRDTTKPAAQELQKLGIEVVKGDQDDKASLSAVMKGAHTVFAVTATVYDDKLYEREYEQGRAMVDAAVAAGVKYFIFSTLSGIKEGSGGKLTGGGHFDVKYDIEKYIVSRPSLDLSFQYPECPVATPCIFYLCTSPLSHRREQKG